MAEAAKIEIAVSKENGVDVGLMGPGQDVLAGLCAAIAQVIRAQVAGGDNDETRVAYMIHMVNDLVLDYYEDVKAQEADEQEVE